MSRSRLRSKFMRERYRGESFIVSKMGIPIKNSHRQDEMPKNSPSRYILTHCSADVSWLQESTSFGGHRIPKGGHRRVSGLVRASSKREAYRVMCEAIEDYNIMKNNNNNRENGKR